MEQFYAQRNGHLNIEDIKISLKELRSFFIDCYNYFYLNRYFELAFNGYRNDPALMVPSPTAYFFDHLGNKKVFPIEDNYYNFDEVTLFTVIEILHLFVRKIDCYGTYEAEGAQEEFRNALNKYLKFYGDGYEVSEKGWVINLPENGLRNLIYSDLPEDTKDEITEQVETAIKMFFHHSSNCEMKKKAINILADILEPYRKGIEKLTCEENDKMIFGIVNQYNIRHNNTKQTFEYDKDIWYEWMFHYYLATVHAALSLVK